MEQTELPFVCMTCGKQNHQDIGKTDFGKGIECPECGSSETAVVIVSTNSLDAGFTVDTLLKTLSFNVSYTHRETTHYFITLIPVKKLAEGSINSTTRKDIILPSTSGYTRKPSSILTPDS